MKPSGDVVADVQQYLSAGQFEQAVKLCDEQLAATPLDIPLLTLLTFACEHAGDIQKARKAALRWVDAAPLDAHAHYRLGSIDQRLSDYSSAMDRYEIAADMAAPGDQVAEAADRAIAVLDNQQLQQILALRDVDLDFRVKLLHDPRRALRERGFALTEDTFYRLAAANDRDHARSGPRPPRPC